jgi:hypothetical protein
MLEQTKQLIRYETINLVHYCIFKFSFIGTHYTPHSTPAPPLLLNDILYVPALKETFFFISKRILLEKRKAQSSIQGVYKRDN